MDDNEFRSQALEAYDNWQGVLRSDRDDYNAYSDLIKIYRQALLDPNQSIAQALEAVWTSPEIE